MGKIVQKPIMSHGRLATGVAISLLLGLAASLPMQAQPTGGLNISQEAGAIQVNMDSQASSEVSIRRSADAMIIRLPKTAETKLTIDPALKQDNIVQEVETPTGKSITIYSQQIYLQNQSSTANSKPPTPKAGNVAGTTAPKKVESSGQAKKAEDNASVKPVMVAVKPEKEATSSKPGKSAKNPYRDASLSEIARLLETASSLDTAGLDATNARKAAETAAMKASLTQQESTTSFKSGHSPAIEISTDPNAFKSENPAQKPLPDLETDPEIESMEPSDQPVAMMMDPTDPESLPLDLTTDANPLQSSNSHYLLVRITLSLAAVLAMMAAFLKWGLPKIMERHPAFFEHLKRQQSAANALGMDADSELGVVNRADASKSTLKPSKTAKTSAWPIATRPKKSTQQQYLERLQVEGAHFQIITSSPLGNGKELHLVEIQGRQLVVATTPYTVTLLKDLTNEEANGESPELSNPLIGDSALPRNRTVAYLAEDAQSKPVQAEPTAHSLMSEPQASTTQSTSPASPTHPALQAEAQKTQVYRKYTGHPGKRMPHVKPATPPAEMPYVDAEEVVVLEDYDDVYRY